MDKRRRRWLLSIETAVSVDRMQVERILCWNVDITRKGFPIAVGNDGGGREMTGRDSRLRSGITEMSDRLLEWLPDRAGMTNEVDGLLIGIPDRIGYTEKTLE